MTAYTILCPVVHPGRSRDERMFLQQDVEFGAVLVDCPPKQIRLTERNEDFVKMPCAARFAASSFYAMCEARAEFVAPAADRLVTDNDTALEQQFFNIAQAKLETEIPPNRETNDRRREPVAVIKRFSLLHRDFLRDHLANVTVPWRVLRDRIEDRGHRVFAQVREHGRQNVPARQRHSPSGSLGCHDRSGQRCIPDGGKRPSWPARGPGESGKVHLSGEEMSGALDEYRQALQRLEDGQCAFRRT
ncbi:hypothetical protein OKW34_003596 [Paraburkholderia youngii]